MIINNHSFWLKFNDMELFFIVLVYFDYNLVNESERERERDKNINR